MAMTIDLNADAGESYGRWKLGEDDQLFPYLTSVSVACGYHAGDPGTMREAARLARENGVALGAHPGFPDLLGFGRRKIEASTSDIVDYCLYQLGALQAIAAAEGTRVEHVKPHGALYALVSSSPDVAETIAEVVHGLDPALILVLLDGPAADAAARKGTLIAREAFVDIDYSDDGRLVIELVKKARDPESVAARAVDVVQGRLTTKSGRQLDVRADTICLHGDAPNAVDIARAVRDRLVDEGVTLAPLREVVESRNGSKHR